MSEKTLDKLPIGWADAEFGDVCSIRNGYAFKSKDFTSSGVPLIKQGNLTGSEVDLSGCAYLPAPYLEEHAQYQVRRGDILLGMSGSIGEPSEYCHDAPALQNQRTGLLRPNNAVDLAFVRFFLEYSQAQLLDRSKGMAIQNVSAKDIQSMPLALPPLNEQQRIVEKIETLFARLDKGEEAVRDVQKLLTRYRQSVLKSAVTGQLTADWRSKQSGQLEHGRDLLARILETRRETWDGRGKYKEPLQPDDSEFPDLPEGWAKASVDQVTSNFGNGLSKKPVLEPNDFPILRISAARAMKVSVDDLRYYEPSDGENIDRFWVETGDLLFTRYNGSARLVGVCGQMREQERFLHPDKLIKARPIGIPDLSTDYLELAWNCGATRQHIAKNIKTTAGQQGIAGSDIKTAPFPLPSGPEQIEIASRVWDVFARTEVMAKWCETELKRSASLRQSILKDAFAGKLVPQDPTDEPASALLARIAAEKPTAKKTRRKTSA